MMFDGTPKVGVYDLASTPAMVDPLSESIRRHIPEIPDRHGVIADRLCGSECWQKLTCVWWADCCSAASVHLRQCHSNVLHVESL